MGASVHESFGDHGICAVCRRDPVSRWCDYVVDYVNSVTFLRNYKDFVAVNNGNDYTTCDLPMCDKCATSVGRDRDLCPHHMSLHRQTELPDQYQRRRQIQARSTMYREDN
ncbi:hypothetical protein ACIFOE_05055 [Paenibacillus sp. NRS-1783]|uniref:hypothetical protein n=1 Tax=Paenibacillus sp. NRS-1783 TaxID=3233907 RepID=UPI003D2B78D1